MYGVRCGSDPRFSGRTFYHQFPATDSSWADGTIAVAHPEPISLLLSLPPDQGSGHHVVEALFAVGPNAHQVADAQDQ